MCASNLPTWPGASAVYSNLYTVLARMAPTHVVKRSGKCFPSEDMNEIIEALRKGDENALKSLQMTAYDRGFL